MSSDESRTTSSSRLSQFGLYRTIDARTEEFLRLSRKRQIRQGCACAAVSTAITVTVVVTVLLVYEYSVNLDTKTDQKPIRKPNWFGLFNDSSPFDAKYNKAKLNIDPTTFKLLPIILKALNHNRYLDKLVEDSSASPPIEKKDTTEISYQRNVFSNIKNWVRMPTPKQSTMEYKTSPVVYYKLPTKNLDEFTKHRKIREYQRIMNYFDKMISDKVTGLNMPTMYEYRTENSLNDSTIPAKKSLRWNKHGEVVTPTTPKHTTPKKPSSYCKCPKKLGILLNKLLSTIQDILPEILIAKSPCRDEETTFSTPAEVTVSSTTTTTMPTKPTKPTVINTISKSTTRKLPTTSKLIKPNSTLRYRHFTPKYSKNFATKNEDVKTNINNIKSKPTTEYPSTTTERIKQYNTQRIEYSTHKQHEEFIIQNRDYKTNNQHSAFGSIIKDFLKRYYSPTKKEQIIAIQSNIDVVKENNSIDANKKLNNDETTTYKAYIEAPNISSYLKQLITEPMPKSTHNNTINNLTTTDPNIKVQNTLNDSDVESQLSIFKDYIDILSGTNTDNLNLGQINEKLPITKGIEPKILDETTTDNIPFDININDLNLFSLRKVGDLMIPAVVKEDSDIMTKTTKPTEIPKIENEYSTSPIRINTSKVINIPTTKHSKEKDWEDDVKAITEFDLPTEEYDNEKSNYKYTPNSIIWRHTNVDSSLEKAVLPNSAESKENKSKMSKSMLPKSRPIYLEINRNHEWKQDDHQDYIKKDNYNIMYDEILSN